MDPLTPAQHAELLRAAFEAQERERSVVAAELHEGVGQSLKAMLLGLQSLDDCAVAEQREHLRELASQALDAVRRIALELRPSTLDELGLPAALRAEARQAEQRGNVMITVLADVPERPRRPLGGAPEAEVALFRVAQEALANVVEHAQAENASLVLTAVRGWFHLVVEDDGVGILEGASGRAAPIGLAGARARVLALGGELSVESSRGGGTSIYARVPAL